MFGGQKRRASNNNKQHDPYCSNLVIACSVCLDRFCTAQQLAAHMGKKHQTRTVADSFVRSNVCWGCGKNYITRSRMIQHVSKKNPGALKCFGVLWDHVVAHNLWLSASERSVLNTLELDNVRRLRALGFRYHHAEGPAIRVCGPRMRNDRCK